MKIEDLTKSYDPFIAETAEKAAKYKQMLDTGDLTANEFDELMIDLCDLEKINQAAESIRHKVMLEQAISTIKVLVGFLK